MEEIIQPVKLSINEIFKNTEYEIPIYQRSYAWEKDEIEQLITDINDSTGNYYLGSLIVNNIAPHRYSVIDGQQRLTTIYLLLSYLDSSLIKANSLTFQARDKSNETLKIIREHKKFENEIFYSEEIIAGIKIISNFFEAQTNKESYKKAFIDKLSNIIIIRTQVPQKIDLNHYFEIMNTRGEQLEIHEIAKGRLLRAISNEEDRDIAATIWDSCSIMKSYIQMNFNTTLRPLLFGNNWDSFNVNSFDDIREIFLKAQKQNDLAQNTTTKKFSIFEKLENFKPLPKTVNKKEDNENDRFESIVSFPYFLLIANEALVSASNEDDAQLDDKHFFATLEHNWDSNESALSFIFNLLRYRFIFDTFVIKRQTLKGESSWSLLKLKRYRDQTRNTDKPSYEMPFNLDIFNENIRMLQSVLRITYTSPKTMHWISKLLSSIENTNVIDPSKLLNTLEKYSCMKVKEADYKNATGFGIARIVFTYLDYILIRDYSKQLNINNFQFQFRTSIEHFYPQHPDNIKVWDTEPLNNFGNLALITVVSNSRFSNLKPSSKVDTYPDTINQSPKLIIMSREMIKNNNNWDESLAYKHGTEMLNLLETEIDKLLD